MNRLAACARGLLLAALMASPAFADGRHARPTPDVAAPPVQQAPVRAAPIAPATPATLPAPIGQTGAIALPAETGLALNVPRSYRFYTADAAQEFLRRNNAAAPSGQILGLLMPAATNPTTADAWGVVLSYQPIGHVATDGTAKLADPALEAQVRAARVGANRPFEGFAQPPVFVLATPSLSWAERSAAPGVGGRDLRYEIRMLGRTAVSGLTAVGSQDQLPAVTAAAPDLMTMLTFGAGQRYSDFSQGADQVSAYDLAALVIGAPEASQGLVADAASAEGGGLQTVSSGGGGLLGGLFPWIAGGVVVLAGIGYLVARMMSRRNADDLDEVEDEADANITPREET